MGGFKFLMAGKGARQWIDRARVDYIPTNYTRRITPGESERENEFSSHAAGIDDALGVGTATICDTAPDTTIDTALPIGETIVPLSVTVTETYVGTVNLSLTGYIASTQQAGSTCSFRPHIDGVPILSGVTFTFDVLGSEFTAAWSAIAELDPGETLTVRITTANRDAVLENTAVLSELCITGVTGGGGGGLSDAYTDVATTSGNTPATGADTLNLLGVGLNNTDVSSGDVRILTTMDSNHLAARVTAGTGDQEQIDPSDVTIAAPLSASTVLFWTTGINTADLRISQIADLYDSITNAIPNTALQDIAGSSYVGNADVGAADRKAFTIGDLPTKATPIPADRLPGWDSTDSSLKEFSATSVGTPPYASAWDVGKRYFQPAYVGSDTSTARDYQTITGSQAIYFSQAYVPRSGYVLANLSFRLIAGGGLGATIHVAVYTDVSGRPGELLFNATVANATNIINQVDITTLELDAGHYWLGIQVSDTDMEFTTAVLSQTAPYLGEKDDQTAFAQGVTQRTESPVTLGTWPTTADASSESIKDLLLIGLSRDS